MKTMYFFTVLMLFCTVTQCAFSCRPCLCDGSSNRVLCRGEHINRLFLDTFWKRKMSTLTLINTKMHNFHFSKTDFPNLKTLNLYQNIYLDCMDIRDIQAEMEVNHDMSCDLEVTPLTSIFMETEVTSTEFTSGMKVSENDFSSPVEITKSESTPTMKVTSIVSSYAEVTGSKVSSISEVMGTGLTEETSVAESTSINETSVIPTAAVEVSVTTSTPAIEVRVTEELSATDPSSIEQEVSDCVFTSAIEMTGAEETGTESAIEVTATELTGNELTEEISITETSYVEETSVTAVSSIMQLYTGKKIEMTGAEEPGTESAIDVTVTELTGNELTEEISITETSYVEETSVTAVSSIMQLYTGSDRKQLLIIVLTVSGSVLCVTLFAVIYGYLLWKRNARLSQGRHYSKT